MDADPRTARDWMLASIQIDFVAETFYGKDVVAKITGAEVGNSSLNILCELYQEDRLTVRGKSVLVYMDTAAKSSVRIPDSLREMIASG